MTLVDEALARPESEREYFLRGACAKDANLFDEVWDRIQWELRMKGFLLEPFLPQTGIEHPFEVGEVLAGRFRLVREIGRGGMGVVYEAVDTRLEKRIAIKCAKPGFQWRLPPEARHATEISHPNVCKIHEIHTTWTSHGDVDFLTMEYLDGETLSERIQRRGRLAVEAVRDIARQVCAGLAEAHRKGVIHGDLKSSNIILVDGGGGQMRAVITDFGLARQAVGLSATRLQTSPHGGTLAYMAPELWRGEKASVASDLYALGVILFEALSGRFPLPPDGKLHDHSNKRAKRVRRIVRRVPRRFDAVIAQCLDSVPARRPSSAVQVSAAAMNPHPGWRIARVTAMFVAVGMLGLPVTREPVRNPVHLALLPFDASRQEKPLADATLLKTSDLLAKVKPSGWRFSIISFAESVRRHVRNPGQACRELGASHVLRGDLQRSGAIINVRAAVVDACSQQNVKELALEYAPSDEGQMPLALAGVVTGALRLPPVRSAKSVNSSAYPDYAAALRYLQQESKVDDAIASLERATASDTHSVLAWAALAEAYRVRFKVNNEPRYQDLAVRAAKKAESLNPDAAPVCRITGLLRIESGLYARASEDFFRAIELDPMNPDGYLGLARAEQRMDRPQEALKAFFKAIEVAPRYFRAYQKLGGFYYDLGEYEKSAEQLRKVVELTPNAPEGYVSVSSVYIKLGRYADAERELRTALGLRETLDARVNLGAALAYEGRYLEAITHYQRAIVLAPNDYLSWVNVGDNFRRTHQPKQAQRMYRRALNLTQQEVSRSPQDAYVRAFVAYLFARLGQNGRAEYEISQSLQTPPADAQVLRVAALTYEALGKRQRTLSVLKDAPRSLIADLSRQPDVAGLRTDSRFTALLANPKSQ